MKTQGDTLIIKLPHQKKISYVKKHRAIWLLISPGILIVMAVLFGLSEYINVPWCDYDLNIIIFFWVGLMGFYLFGWLIGVFIFFGRFIFKLAWSVSNRIKEESWQLEPPEYTVVRVTPHTFTLERDRNSCYTLDHLHNVRVMRPAGNHATTCVHFDYAGETPETVTIGEQLDEEQTCWLAETLQNVFAFRCHQVEQVVFGAALPRDMLPSVSLLNPDVSDLHVPFWRLTRIVVVMQEYNFHLVERFVTYVVNALGQKYLKTSVDVEIYGDPAELHPNLRNSLTNLCRNVTVKDRSS